MHSGPGRNPIAAGEVAQRGRRVCSSVSEEAVKMMPMYFFFSDKVVLLFDFWNVHSPAGMVLTVLVIMLLSVLYEAIKVGREKLRQWTMPAKTTSLSQEKLEEPETAPENTGQGQQPARTAGKWFLWHCTQTLLHVIQVVLGYMVMLAVMSYNTWIFFGVIAGSTIGYYIAYPLLNTR